MHDGSYEKVPRENLFETLEKHGALEETKKRAHLYAATAQQNLEVLPKSKYRDALAEIAAFIVNRES
jgi:geranylgeranyl pyrophosphate synthase